MPRHVKQGHIDDLGIGHIPLTQGKEALCDAENFPELSRYNWCASYDKKGHWYAMRRVGEVDGKQVNQKMHRAVMQLDDPQTEVDHKDRNATLDNRKQNLRVVSRQQNMCNRGCFASVIRSSSFKGVSKNRNRYRAEIQVNGVRKQLGSFGTEREAASAYNVAAREFHGEFAVLNDIS
jgi:hypothetical protein